MSECTCRCKRFCANLPNVHALIASQGMCEASENDAGGYVFPFTIAFSEKNRKNFKEKAMDESQAYLHIILTKPQAFLLLSYLHLRALVYRSNTFTYTPGELRTVGCRPVLTSQQARRMLLFLQERGYISITKITHMRPLVEVTLLRGEFPYV
jgi:hypothetical protein